ncbi:hypothetical protein, partial [uncultured Muribaculum sp.]|uniref:hypothetical protein n=1 Tax=uncultured Muribaculum sp. TaxID=1918613 RepID=UPI002593271D
QFREQMLTLNLGYKGKSYLQINLSGFPLPPKLKADISRSYGTPCHQPPFGSQSFVFGRK